jgi:hypothetical protein
MKSMDGVVRRLPVKYEGGSLDLIVVKMGTSVLFRYLSGDSASSWLKTATHASRRKFKQKNMEQETYNFMGVPLHTI